MPWDDILIQFLATLFGVIAGIPAALMIDREITKTHERKNAIYLLKNISSEIEDNIAVILEIQAKLNAEKAYVKTLSLNQCNLAPFGEFRRLVDNALLREIDSTYDGFELLSKKLEIQITIHYSAIRTANPSRIYEQERRNIVSAILLDLPGILDRCNRILPKINKQIDLLERQKNLKTKLKLI